MGHHSSSEPDGESTGWVSLCRAFNRQYRSNQQRVGYHSVAELLAAHSGEENTDDRDTTPRGVSVLEPKIRFHTYPGRLQLRPIVTTSDGNKRGAEGRQAQKGVPTPLLKQSWKPADALDSTVSAGVKNNCTVYSPGASAFTALTFTVFTVPGRRSCHPLTTPCRRSLSVVVIEVGVGRM